MYRILHLPDLHVGSTWAPLADYVKLKDNINGQPFGVTPSSLQSYLYREYEKIVLNGDWDLVVCNGDIIDGPNKGAEGKYCWTADVKQQVEAAYQMLSIIDTDKWLFTMGTPYHSVDDRPGEEMLAEKFEAPFAYDFLVKIEDFKVHVAHCIDYKGNKFGALASELGTNGAGLVLRGHRHECAVVSDGKRYAAIGPCWQWRNQFGLINGMYSGTDIGAQEICIDGDRISIESHLVDMSSFRKAVDIETLYQ